MSIEYTRRKFPEVGTCPSASNVIIADQTFRESLLEFVRRVKDQKVYVACSLYPRSNNLPLYCSEPLKGVHKSVEFIARCMYYKDMKINDGFIYQKTPGALITYERCLSVESFLSRAQRDPYIAGNVSISISRIGQLTEFFGHNDYSFWRKPFMADH